MTAPLSTLRQKKRRRAKARDRQWRLWRRTGKRGHRKAFRVHRRAVRKLRGLIRKASTPSSISPAGVRFIASFEGFSARPTDALDGFSTVGYGHLIAHRRVTAADRRAIWVPGQRTPGVLTTKEAETLLAEDLSKVYEPAVLKLFQKGGPLAGRWSQPLMDALTSVAYNLGVGAVTPGAVAGFETLHAAIRGGSPAGIADSLRLYVRGPSGPLPGLVRRRRAEARMIRTGSYSTD